MNKLILEVLPQVQEDIEHTGEENNEQSTMHELLPPAINEEASGDESEDYSSDTNSAPEPYEYS